MRDWLSAPEFASLALPGLPATERGWRDYAEREGWLATDKVRAREGRGGGLEYHIDLLPGAALAAYVSRQLGKRMGAVDLDATDAAAAARDDGACQLSLPAIEGRDARLALIRAADKLAREAGMSRHLADRAFCALYGLGQIEVAPWVRQTCSQLSPRTLRRWRTLKTREGGSRLGVDKGAARRGKGRIESGEEGKVRAFLLAEIARQPHIAGRKLRNLVADQFPALGDVSQRTVERIAAKIRREDKVVLTALTNPDRFKSRYRLAGGNVASDVSRINELWEIDASPADVLLLDGRYSIYACVDVFTRRVIILATKTPRAEAVGLLIRRALMEWGVPERVKTDNGSDFTARFTKYLFNALGIEVELCPPYSPEKKPHVERAIKTFQHDFCADLPGFVGHNVADRKVIEERRSFAQRLGLDDAGAFKVELAAPQFQSRADAWAATDYATRPHSGIGCSPFEKAAAFRHVERRIDDVRALDVLLAPIAKGDGTRLVTKRGVRIEHRYYLTQLMPETRVFVRMDPADMGRVWLFSPDGAEFLGEGVCPEVAGIDPAAAVVEMRRWQKRTLDETMTPLRAEIKKRSQLDIADIFARQAAERAGKLVEFPKPSESYTTPALEAARAALDRPAPAPATETQRATLAEIEQELAIASPGPAPAPVHQLPETRQQRYRRALDLEARMANNERLPNDETLWLGGYRTTAEYRAMKEMFEEFGEAALK